MFNRTRTLVFLTLVFAVALAACGGNSAASNNGTNPTLPLLPTARMAAKAAWKPRLSPLRMPPGAGCYSAVRVFSSRMILLA